LVTNTETIKPKSVSFENQNVESKECKTLSKKYIDTKQSNKKNNQNSKDKRQDYNRK